MFHVNILSSVLLILLTLTALKSIIDEKLHYSMDIFECGNTSIPTLPQLPHPTSIRTRYYRLNFCIRREPIIGRYAAQVDCHRTAWKNNTCVTFVAICDCVSYVYSHVCWIVFFDGFVFGFIVIRWCAYESSLFLSIIVDPPTLCSHVWAFISGPIIIKTNST